MVVGEAQDGGNGWDTDLDKGKGSSVSQGERPGAVPSLIVLREDQSY